jgi:two-component system OmpR family response regulator
MTADGPVPRVLVAAAEPGIRERVRAALRLHGCAVTTTTTGQDVLRRAGSANHDLIVLDAVLPDLDGIEVCHRLRASGDTVPVIFLTAPGAVPEPGAGASGYVTKPFSAEALAARILAALGRAGRAVGDLGAAARLHAGDLELDEIRWTVHKAGTPVELSPTEFRLLIYLMSNQGRTLSREQILQNVWGQDETRQPQIVDTYVSYLRRKLDPLGAPLIHTERGAGYSLADAASRHSGHDAT